MCFHWKTGADLRSALFLFSWRCPKGTIRDYFLYSNHHIRNPCWVRSIPERLRGCPYLWFQENVIYFRQRSQDAGLCPAEFLGQFLCDPAFNLLRNLLDVFLSNCRKRQVPWLAVPRLLLLCFSWNICQFLLAPWRCHLFEGKKSGKVVTTDFCVFFVELQKKMESQSLSE